MEEERERRLESLFEADLEVGAGRLALLDLVPLDLLAGRLGLEMEEACFRGWRLAL